VSPATNCSGVALVDWWRWIVTIAYSWIVEVVSLPITTMSSSPTTVAADPS
jgi:hypothetical protein